ncbi:MAG: twin-arginine translocase subunit TatC [Candidatus Riflebacteria bacterium]|nr:twin-arginine translocase subunit TatC [Candidatus Riflebacteria bacterium]
MLQGENKNGTFTEHLEELRWALIRSLVSITVIFPLAFLFSDDITTLAIRHFCPPGLTLRYFSPIEPLMVKLKMSLYIAIFVAAPYVLRQAWNFMAPGLYAAEKSFAGWLLLFSWLLFAGGSAFALIVILPVIMSFSLKMQTPYLEAAIGFDQFTALIGMLTLAFGIMFQWPTAIFMAVKTGLTSVDKLKSLRAIIFVIILIISAILTPPDVFSQLMMAIPTYLLFEVGLLVASLTSPRS